MSADGLLRVPVLFGNLGDEPVSPLGDRLNEAGILGVISQRFP
jgi:hypothetical protein